MHVCASAHTCAHTHRRTPTNQAHLLSQGTRSRPSARTWDALPTGVRVRTSISARVTDQNTTRRAR